jgi:urease accessory protein
MRFVARALILVALLAMAEPASAHNVLGATGFTGGLLHPFVVPTHIVAAAALALLMGQQNWGSSTFAVYAVAIIAGLGTVALAYVPTRAEEALLMLAAVIGLLVAWSRRLPLATGLTFAAAVGFALALDSPPEGISLAEANLALLGTAISAVIVLVALVQMTSRLTRLWQRVGARILGSWIAASAVLVLALWLAG